MAFRVPTINGLIMDPTCKLEEPVTYEETRVKIKGRTKDDMKGFLGFREEARLSTGVATDTTSGTFTAKSRQHHLIGELFGQLETAEAPQVKKIVPFEGDFNFAAMDSAASEQKHVEVILSEFELALGGHVPHQEIAALVQQLFRKPPPQTCTEVANKALDKYLAVEGSYVEQLTSIVSEVLAYLTLVPS